MKTPDFILCDMFTQKCWWLGHYKSLPIRAWNGNAQQTSPSGCSSRNLSALTHWLCPLGYILQLEITDIHYHWIWWFLDADSCLTQHMVLNCHKENRPDRKTIRVTRPRCLMYESGKETSSFRFTYVVWRMQNFMFPNLYFY